MNKTTEATRQTLNFPTLWTAARDRIAARRSSDSAREQLAAELADYTTTAERNDLNALLDSYPDADVAEVRDLLNRTPIG
jgi:hypothetical protein